MIFFKKGKFPVPLFENFAGLTVKTQLSQSGKGEEGRDAKNGKEPAFASEQEMGISLGKVRGRIPFLTAIGVHFQTRIKGEVFLLVSPQGLRLRVQFAAESRKGPCMIRAERGEG